MMSKSRTATYYTLNKIYLTERIKSNPKFRCEKVRGVKILHGNCAKRFFFRSQWHCSAVRVNPGISVDRQKRKL